VEWLLRCRGGCGAQSVQPGGGVFATAGRAAAARRAACMRRALATAPDCRPRVLSLAPPLTLHSSAPPININPGTAGLRGKMGPGFSRMNIVTVQQSTQVGPGPPRGGGGLPALLRWEDLRAAVLLTPTPGRPAHTPTPLPQGLCRYLQQECPELLKQGGVLLGEAADRGRQD
jgi:hypothetical protein